MQSLKLVCMDDIMYGKTFPAVCSNGAYCIHMIEYVQHEITYSCNLHLWVVNSATKHCLNLISLW